MSTPDTMTTLASAPWFDADGNPLPITPLPGLRPEAIEGLAGAYPAVISPLVIGRAPVWLPVLKPTFLESGPSCFDQHLPLSTHRQMKSRVQEPLRSQSESNYRGAAFVTRRANASEQLRHIHRAWSAGELARHCGI